MKRLLTSLLISLFLLVGISSTAFADTRYVKVDIFEPAVTSNRTLNVEYKVISTIETDTFGVELFENGALKGTQEITTPFGDSGVFNLTLPASGTYSYYVRTANHGNGNAVLDSKTVSVQVTNAPQPIVTTVNTANNNTNGGAGAGDVAGDADGDGVVDDRAATTQAQKNADVLATKDNNANGIPDDEEKEDDNKEESTDSDVWWYVGGATAVLLGGAYYFRGIRRAGK